MKCDWDKNLVDYTGNWFHIPFVLKRAVCGRISVFGAEFSSTSVPLPQLSIPFKRAGRRRVSPRTDYCTGNAYFCGSVEFANRRNVYETRSPLICAPKTRRTILETGSLSRTVEIGKALVISCYGTALKPLFTLLYTRFCYR